MSNHITRSLKLNFVKKEQKIEPEGSKVYNAHIAQDKSKHSLESLLYGEATFFYLLMNISHGHGQV